MPCDVWRAANAIEPLGQRKSAVAHLARVKAVIGYLTGSLNLSHRDTVEAMQELFAVKLSLGSIAACKKESVWR